MKDFDKVIGYDDIKLELERCLDTMNNVEKYQKLGAKIPKGILLNGKPGVGKTLMATCFIKASGRQAFVCRKDKPNGEFVTAIKDTFKKAKENTPSIVFLDDMDKFANEDDNHRNAEEYVTIQACIDDVKDADVFILATTNCIRNLPDSLIRVGRFDKVIKVNNPIGDDAEKIIDYYLSQKQNIGNVNAKDIARLLNGGSCAELETVINEAAIYAGFDGKDKIEMEDLIRACLRVIFDAPESLSKEDKLNIKKIAFHEAGHAVVAEILEPGSINIVSVKNYSGDKGGVTSYEISKGYWYSKQLMENRVISLLGGKAATEIIFNEVDVGANSDLHRAFEIVERFVDNYCSYGFDKFERRACSNDLYEKRDNKIAEDMQLYYNKAKEILFKNRELLDSVANELLEKETITYKEIQEIKSEIANKLAERQKVEKEKQKLENELSLIKKYITFSFINGIDKHVFIIARKYEDGKLIDIYKRKIGVKWTKKGYVLSKNIDYDMIPVSEFIKEFNNFTENKSLTIITNDFIPDDCYKLLLSIYKKEFDFNLLDFEKLLVVIDKDKYHEICYNWFGKENSNMDENEKIHYALLDVIKLIKGEN